MSLYFMTIRNTKITHPSHPYFPYRGTCKNKKCRFWPYLGVSESVLKDQNSAIEKYVVLHQKTFSSLFISNIKYYEIFLRFDHRIRKTFKLLVKLYL